VTVAVDDTTATRPTSRSAHPRRICCCSVVACWGASCEVRVWAGGDLPPWSAGCVTPPKGPGDTWRPRPSCRCWSTRPASPCTAPSSRRRPTVASCTPGRRIHVWRVSRILNRVRGLH